MMPQGNPVNWSNTARAAQAYAYVLVRGGDEAQAARAALVHVLPAQLPQVQQLAYAARAAAYALNNPADVTNADLQGEVAQASQLGANRVVATVRVLVEGGDGNQRWSTIQPAFAPGASLDEMLTEITLIATQLAEGTDMGYAGKLIDWQVETVIGHVPGGP